MGDGITRYHTEAEIREDGTVEVTESITYDFGYRPSAGISRHIPVDLGSGPLRSRHVEVRDLEVRSPTGAETALDFEGVEEGEHLVLIGLEDSPETHVTKEQTYEISYTLVGAIVERRGHDEFHWNFVGSEWDVPKDDVSVEITAPEISDLSCHRKVEGEDRGCHGFEHDGTTAVVSPSFLSEDEGMAVTVSLPSGAVDTSAVLTELNDFWRPALWSGSLALLMLVLAIACPMYRALAETRARRRMPDLPRDLHPLTAYSMLHDRVRVSRAALILLALSEEKGDGLRARTRSAGWPTLPPADRRAEPRPGASGGAVAPQGLREWAHHRPGHTRLLARPERGERVVQGHDRRTAGVHEAHRPRALDDVHRHRDRPRGGLRVLTGR
ncbi:DUF2207 domain-containing protein [Nocardiopsis alba]|uniref:DUF2207 domain-containing protein n=1 Tax=Nocardiopsis alba TaxID=53437 RepID=UPI0036CA02CD